MEVQPSNNFDYTAVPLSTDDSIRLIAVQHDAVSEEPIFDLKVYSLSSIPEYHAVSYVWGSNIRSRQLHLPNNQTIWITENLELALKYVVPRCSSGLLWIDQLCML